MKTIVDACTAILLAKAGVLDAAAKEFGFSLTESVLGEVLEGKAKKFADAFIVERLVNEKRIMVVSKKDSKLINRLVVDFGMAEGEASTIAAYLLGGFDAVGTDNNQGRKAAFVSGIPLIGSIETIIALHNRKCIDKDRAKQALSILKKEGWFNNLLIEKALEDLK